MDFLSVDAEVVLVGVAFRFDRGGGSGGVEVSLTFSERLLGSGGGSVVVVLRVLDGGVLEWGVVSPSRPERLLSVGEYQGLALEALGGLDGLTSAVMGVVGGLS